ncbi:hypothetical protein FQN49_006069 [Arthroderma sp. PD_2]|nr:hypothetical protein FQN49_006069 [Arthroderma sp. PD_2]
MQDHYSVHETGDHTVAKSEPSPMGDHSSTQPPQSGTNEMEPNKSDTSDVVSQGERQKLRATVPDTVRPAASAIIPAVRKCSWESFVNRFSETEPVYAIESLVTGDQLGKEMLEEAGRRKVSGYFQAAEYETQGKVCRVFTHASWIHRIRIQSPTLLDTFSRVTGYAWGSQSYTFMRPFQYLHHFHDRFEGELQRLEEEQRRTTHLRPQGEEPPAVSHLRAYIRFANEELRPDYHRFHGQKGSTRVRFNDLWYLFKPGELIYIPDRTLERFLSNNVASGIQWISNASHQSSMRQKIWRLREVIIPYADPSALVNNDVERNSFEGCVYYLDYDGSAYRPVCSTFEISWFESEKDIRDLDFYPVRYAPNADELLDQHKKVGDIVTKCISRRHMSYNGWSLITDPVGMPITEWEWPFAMIKRQARPRHIDGEVIVDFNEAFNSDPRLKNRFEEHNLWENMNGLSKTVSGPDLLATWSDRQRSKVVSVSREIIITGDDVEEALRSSYMKRDRYLDPHKDPNHTPCGDDLALLPRRVFVYSLTEGMFAPVDVRYMKAIDHSNDEFDRLQLPDGLKRMIRSAVRSHLRRKSIERVIECDPERGQLVTQDFICGKGRGLTMMLHGEPGIGKTATAEAVAQTFKRPLFSISCGSLDGTWIAEKRLEEIFRLADMWDCILLLGTGDEPNETVFLRKLEYYNGILFLTTNRIGKIDQAISSRIHLMLHYKRLGKAEIEGIFRINIDRLRQTEKQQNEAGAERVLVPVESDILRFAADHWNDHPKGIGAWNGRQIRNAFLIAAALARDEAEEEPPEFQPQLRYCHFKQVEKVMAEYARFRAHVIGKNDSQQALLNEERDDDYEDQVTEEERYRAGYTRQGLSPEARPEMMSFATSFQQHQNTRHAHAHVHGHSTTVPAGLQAAGRNASLSSAYEYRHSSQMSPPPQATTSWPIVGGMAGFRGAGLGREPIDNGD